MHWVLWTLLWFQGHAPESPLGETSLRNLNSLQRDEFARESAIDDARGKRSKNTAEASRRALAAAQEKQFLDRYNRLMKAMMEFAESYNNRHTIDNKLLQAVKRALQDLQKHDALFRDGGKE